MACPFRLRRSTFRSSDFFLSFSSLSFESCSYSTPSRTSPVLSSHLSSLLFSFHVHSHRIEEECCNLAITIRYSLYT